MEKHSLKKIGVKLPEKKETDAQPVFQVKTDYFTATPDIKYAYLCQIMNWVCSECDEIFDIKCRMIDFNHFKEHCEFSYKGLCGDPDKKDATDCTSKDCRLWNDMELK